MITKKFFNMPARILQPFLFLSVSILILFGLVAPTSLFSISASAQIVPGVGVLNIQNFLDNDFRMTVTDTSGNQSNEILSRFSSNLMVCVDGQIAYGSAPDGTFIPISNTFLASITDFPFLPSIAFDRHSTYDEQIRSHSRSLYLPVGVRTIQFFLQDRHFYFPDSVETSADCTSANPQYLGEVEVNISENITRVLTLNGNPRVDVDEVGYSNQGTTTLSGLTGISIEYTQLNPSFTTPVSEMCISQNFPVDPIETVYSLVSETASGSGFFQLPAGQYRIAPYFDPKGQLNLPSCLSADYLNYYEITVNSGEITSINYFENIVDPEVRWNNHVTINEFNEFSWTDFFGSGAATSEVVQTTHTVRNEIVQSVRGYDNGIYTRVSDNGLSWSPWQLSGFTPGKITMVEFGDKLLQSVRGTDNVIYTRYRKADGVWTTWLQSAGSTPDNIAMIASENVVVQAVRGTDNGIYTRFLDNTNTLTATPSNDGWSAWLYQGATFQPIEMHEFSSGHIAQVVYGTDGNIYSRVFNTVLESDVSNPGWRAIGAATSLPTLENWQNTIFVSFSSDLFQIQTRVLATDGSVVAIDSPGDTFNRIAMAYTGTRLYQSVQGVDGFIYTRFYDGTWSPWLRKGTTNRDVSLESYFGNVYQSVLGTDGRLYMRTITDSNPDPEYSGLGGWAAAFPTYSQLDDSLIQTVPLRFTPVYAGPRTIIQEPYSIASRLIRIPG